MKTGRPSKYGFNHLLEPDVDLLSFHDSKEGLLKIRAAAHMWAKFIGRKVKTVINANNTEITVTLRD